MRRLRRPRRRTLAAAGTVALLAVGAGVAVARSEASGAPGGDATRAPDYYASSPAVCALLTRDDLRAGLGRTFAAGEDPGFSNTFADMPGVTKCRYPTAEKEGTPHVEIGVVYAYAEDIFDDVRTNRAKRRSQTVPRLGDDASWYPEAHELLVLEDDRIFAVAVPAELFETERDVRERARRLAARALERL